MQKILIGNVRGPAGPQGLQGPKGDIGLQGPTGPQGSPGSQGPAGRQGDTGPRGSKWHTGTGITGTSTAAAVYSGSGIAEAAVNDLYLNTSTSNVYQCTVAGAPSTAKWVFVVCIKGLTGATGAKGATGATGPQGPAGPQGEKGEKGNIGDIGPQGPTGPQGKTGVQGPQGATGATGQRGSNWYKGTGITGTSTTVTVFSGSGVASALVNDLYLNTTTDNVYQCTVAGAPSVAKWVYITCLKGATGPQGPAGQKGDPGATGAQGPKGDTGATGPQGPKGDTGATGPQGPAGPQGAAGAKGATGQRGSNWYKGTGITGTSTTAAIFSGSGVASALVNDLYLNTTTDNVYQCTTAGAPSAAKWVYVTCLKGATGPQGPAGQKGETGATGAQGPKGDTGPQGLKGDTGATGPQGPTGPQGAAGAKGATGATGQRGSNWYKGTGITGTSTTATVFSGSGVLTALVNDLYLNSTTNNVYQCTTAGAPTAAKWVYVTCLKGATGPQGPAGQKGDTGATGAKGATGATGAQGPQGPKGEPGITPIYKTNISIPAASYIDNSSATDGSQEFFKYYADTAITDLTANHYGHYFVQPAAEQYVIKAQTMLGKLRVYSNKKPTEAVVIDCFMYWTA